MKLQYMNINETMSIYNRHTVAEEIVLRIDATMLSPYIVSIYWYQNLLLDGQMNKVYFIFWKISPAMNSICVFFWSKWTGDVVLLTVNHKYKIWRRRLLLIRHKGHQPIRSQMPSGERWTGHLSMYTVLQLQVSPAHTPALATSQGLACFWIYIHVHGYHNTVRCAVVNNSINCCLTMPLGKRSTEQRLCP